MLASSAATRSKSLIVPAYFKLGGIFSTPDSVRTVYKFPRGFTANKHWNPKWKKLRGLKVIKIDLPDFNEKKKDITSEIDITPEETRSFYKERGIQPIRPWHERTFGVFTLSGILDQYIPPEGDGKLSPLNSAGAKQKLEWLKKKGRSWKDLRTIRKFDEDFELYPDFVDKAQEVYIKAHELLAAKDKEQLVDYATEKAYPLMLFNTELKTIRWKFIQSLEPPRVCHIRASEVLTKDNIFAQITVRFHTQQILAVYDRFGRLMYGSESVAKDSLEYVVFEKQISNLYGQWRIHHKIIPDWLPERPPSERTYISTEDEDADSSTARDATADTANVLTSVPL